DVIVGQMSAGGGVSGEAMQRIYATYIEEFGLDQPIGVQFLTYLGKLAQGDLGASFARSPTPVQQLIGEALPWTIALQLPAILVGWIVGNTLGALAAYKKGWLDRVLFPAFMFTSSMPYYCLSILLLYFLAVYIPIF